jgi:hypothetical protein
MSTTPSTCPVASFRRRRRPGRGKRQALLPLLEDRPHADGAGGVNECIATGLVATSATARLAGENSVTDESAVPC